MLNYLDSFRFEDEEAVYEVDFPTDAEKLGTGQFDSEDSSDLFLGPGTEEDFVRLQRLLY